MPVNYASSDNWSPTKSRIFDAFLLKLIRKVKPFIPVGEKFRYFDGSPGPGEDPEIPGRLCSMAHFITRFDRILPNYIAIGTEKSPAMYKGMADFITRLARHDKAIIVKGKNHKKMPEHYIESGHPYGVYYVDCSLNNLLFDGIIEFFNWDNHSNVDLFQHLGAAHIKRTNGHSPGSIMPLADFIARINKTHIFITRPHESAILEGQGNNRDRSGSHQWMHIYATNLTPPPNIKDMGFISINTPEGQELLRFLNEPTSIEVERLRKKEYTKRWRAKLLRQRDAQATE